RREGQRGVYRKSYGFGLRRHKAVDRRRPRRKALQQLHGLKKLEAVGFPAQMRLYWIRHGSETRRIVFYSKIRCPALGGHSFNTPLRCCVLASSWLKLFMET